MHPVEFLLGAVSSGIPVTLLRPHLFTVVVFSMLRLYQGIMEHSGYRFPWDPAHYVPLLTGTYRSSAATAVALDGVAALVAIECSWLVLPLRHIDTHIRDSRQRVARPVVVVVAWGHTPNLQTPPFMTNTTHATVATMATFCGCGMCCVAASSRKNGWRSAAASDGPASVCAVVLAATKRLPKCTRDWYM